jgi:hypothetical protein
MKNLGKILGVIGLLALFATEAMAQSSSGFSGMVNQAKGQFESVTDLIGTISYIAGIGFLFKAILKFKEHNESKGQVPLSNAIVLFIVAGCLLGLPYMVSVSKSTALGAGANSSGINNSGLKSVN